MLDGMNPKSFGHEELSRMTNRLTDLKTTICYSYGMECYHFSCPVKTQGNGNNNHIA